MDGARAMECRARRAGVPPAAEDRRARRRLPPTRVRIESRTNLLFSFEKMALRDAAKSAEGARLFAEGLFELLHGAGPLKQRFARWIESSPRCRGVKRAS